MSDQFLSASITIITVCAVIVAAVSVKLLRDE